MSTKAAPAPASVVHPPVGTFIDNGSIKLVDVLGVGGYGVVYRAVDTRQALGPRSYAIKCLISGHQNPRHRQAHIREIALHQLASAHPGVVTLHRVVEEGSFTYIVMDYAPDHDLFTQILHSCRYLGDDALIKDIFLQLLDAVEYCHSLRIYHRDLKLENILCFDDGLRIAITDFGLATTDKLSDEFRTGSVYHMSPECQGGEFAPSGKYCPMANDIWSLGIILLNLVTGRNPWKSATPGDPTFQAYLRDPINFLPSVLPISAEINAILVRMLDVDWEERMALHEVRYAIEEVTNFYCDGVLFEGSMARCPWAEDVGPQSPPTQSTSSGFAKDVVDAHPHLESCWSKDSNSEIVLNGRCLAKGSSYGECWTKRSSCNATWGALDTPAISSNSDRDQDRFHMDLFNSTQSSQSPSSSLPTTPNSFHTSFGARLPTSLREKQVRMEQQVYRTWTVLSAFEESGIACISDMLRQVSNGAYLDAIRMAEKFILHVEVLFGTIDDLEFYFASLNMKGMSHVREARMLCHKTVQLFTLLLWHTQETGARRVGTTQELLALVTDLAHYRTILIRIALTGALRLEQVQSVKEVITSFLDKLHLLAVQGANPSAKRLVKGSHGEPLNLIPHANLGTQGVMYGFRSLTPEYAGEPPFAETDMGSKVSTNPPSDLCVRCRLTVEADCVRLGTYQRWHSHCIQCTQCGKVATVPIAKDQHQQLSKNRDGKENANGSTQRPDISSARRPSANVGIFSYDTESMKDTPSFGEVPTIILCTKHAHQGCRSGFQPVQRLEQYAFRLNVAVRNLYFILKQQGVVHLSPVQTRNPSSESATARLRPTTAHPSNMTGTAQRYNNDGLPQQSLSQYSQGYLQGNVSHSPQPGYQKLNTSTQYSTPRGNPTKLPDNQNQFLPSLQLQRKNIDSGPDSPSAEFQHFCHHSEENHGEANDCPRFSVQSFEPQVKGLSRDIIVTVGMREEEDLSETHFTADTSTPSRPSLQSTLPVIDAGPDDPSDGISEYWSSYEMSAKSITSRRGSLNFSIGNESNRGLFSGGVVDGDWDRLSVISQQTFATAQEPPPELLLALGLHLDPISRQTPLSSDEPSLAQLPVPGFTGMSTNEGQSHEEESVDSGNSVTNSNVHSPLYNISFIRDVSNVCITGSHINFTTNVMHPDDGVCVGLHTLYLRSDPAALHNSYERQKRVNRQTKAMRAWGSQLLVTSSSSLREYPLSVPCIKTRDLEEVVKDVFTWLYSISSPHSIMWLYDEYEGNLRTSLISQCLADFLGERRDLTASYFYTKRSPFSQAGTSNSAADRKDNPSSIIPTIAYELTRRIPEIEIPIALTAANDLWIFDLSLDEQMKKLIVDPLQAASNIRKEGSCKFPQLFLIHGLEDCDDDDFQELFLRAFWKSLILLQKCIPQKLIVLGRRSPHLRECFSKPEMQGIVRHRPLPVSQDVVV